MMTLWSTQADLWAYPNDVPVYLFSRLFFSEFASKMEGRTSVPGLANRFATTGTGNTKQSVKSASVSDVRGGRTSSSMGNSSGGGKGSVLQDEGSISDSAVSNSLTEQPRNRRSSLGWKPLNVRIFELQCSKTIHAIFICFSDLISKPWKPYCQLLTQKPNFCQEQ